MKYPKMLLLIAAGICVPLFTAGASEDEHGSMMEEEEHGSMHSPEVKLESMDDLIEEVRRLRKEVESLKAVRPTITSLMPRFAERFHVMHYAGDAGDWVVAGHELLAMQQIVKMVHQIDSKQGAMMEGFLADDFEEINEAIEHGNQDSFNDALEDVVDQCNACHTASGSPFIKVTLHATDSLSMRHSHKLQPRKNMGEHTHKHEHED